MGTATWHAGVYMRVRWEARAGTEMEKLVEYVYGKERMVVGGDFNAETAGARARREGAQETAADRVLQGAVEDGALWVVSVMFARALTSSKSYTAKSSVRSTGVGSSFALL